MTLLSYCKIRVNIINTIAISEFKKKVINLLFCKAEILILGIGILLRLRQLLGNPSFWLDETCAAVSITSRTYTEIFFNHEILPDIVHPPMVFAIIEKFFVAVLGNTEMVLRLFPFLCGVGSLLMFCFVAGKMLERKAFLAGLTLFAIAEPLLYFSAELKQYSTDLLCTIILIWLAKNVLDHHFKRVHCFILVVTGIFILWLSNAMIFVLAGIGLVLFLNTPWRKGRHGTAFLCMTALLWLGNFLLLYAVSLRYMAGNASITSAWKGAFHASPLFSVETIRWSWDVITLSFQNPAGLKWWWLQLPCFIYGAWLLWRKDKSTMLLWLLPVVFAFLAGLTGKYPFYGRVILFLTASYYIFIGCAIADLFTKASRVAKTGGILLLMIVFAQPVADSFHSRPKANNRDVMGSLAEYYKPGDFIYFSTSAQPPFWYYAGKTGLSRQFPQPVIGISDNALIRGFKIAKFALDPKELNGRAFMFFRNEYNIFNENGMFRANMGSSRDTEQVSIVPLDSVYNYTATGRTWIILSASGASEAEINLLIRGSFDKRGKRLLSFEGLYTGVYLYDIR